ncbi:hypothetical protein LAZ67_23000820 [Cordylochernes scorpioides]|uniref:Endonuclease/exonuclease/phosphatase domain-containing protein n=1 Tax=Cordylochernes scorpioides TaxID=51811 RepID=A0ABY6LSN4_9ARAC|nr:hypothetical protein LAZ67_23000820 [Cordylochernes scorpioides]
MPSDGLGTRWRMVSLSYRAKPPNAIMNRPVIAEDEVQVAPGNGWEEDPSCRGVNDLIGADGPARGSTNFPCIHIIDKANNASAHENDTQGPSKELRPLKNVREWTRTLDDPGNTPLTVEEAVLKGLQTPLEEAGSSQVEGLNPSNVEEVPLILTSTFETLKKGKRVAVKQMVLLETCFATLLNRCRSLEGSIAEVRELNSALIALIPDKGTFDGMVKDSVRSAMMALALERERSEVMEQPIPREQRVEVPSGGEKEMDGVCGKERRESETAMTAEPSQQTVASVMEKMSPGVAAEKLPPGGKGGGAPVKMKAKKARNPPMSGDKGQNPRGMAPEGGSRVKDKVLGGEPGGGRDREVRKIAMTAETSQQKGVSVMEKSSPGITEAEVPPSGRENGVGAPVKAREKKGRPDTVSKGPTKVRDPPLSGDKGQNPRGMVPGVGSRVKERVPGREPGDRAPPVAPPTPLKPRSVLPKGSGQPIMRPEKETRASRRAPPKGPTKAKEGRSNRWDATRTLVVEKKKDAEGYFLMEVIKRLGAESGCLKAEDKVKATTLLRESVIAECRDLRERPFELVLLGADPKHSSEEIRDFLRNQNGVKLGEKDRLIKVYTRGRQREVKEKVQAGSHAQIQSLWSKALASPKPIMVTPAPYRWRFAQLNAARARRGNEELDRHMKAEGFHVVSVQEPYISRNKMWVDTRYKTFFRGCRKACILVRDDVLCVEYGSWRGVVAVMVETADLRLLCISVYISPSDPEQGVLELLGQMVRNVRIENVLITGDFNARSHFLGDRKDEIRGRNLGDLIISQGLEVWNDWGTTTFSTVNGESVIDLTLYKGSGLVRDSWKAEFADGSDHKLISFTAKSSANPVSVERTPRYSVRGVNIERFLKKFITELENDLERAVDGESLDRAVDGLHLDIINTSRGLGLGQFPWNWESSFLQEEKAALVE